MLTSTGGLFHPHVLQDWILLVLSLGEAAVILFAAADALRHPAAAYASAGKQTRQRWLIILGVATIAVVLLLTSIIGPLNFIMLAAVVAAAVYLADVRPAVSQFRRGPRGRSSGSSGW